MLSNAASRALVLLPIHRLPLPGYELYSVGRTFEVLSNWDVAILCPERLREEIQENRLLSTANQIVSYPDHCFDNVEGYNQLLMNKNFYINLFPYEYLLIVQPDALVLNDQLAYWCEQNWSFIGAPWFKGYDKSSSNELIGVGNGGFSLRNIRDCIRVLDDYSVPSLAKNFLRAPCAFVYDFWVQAKKRYKIVPSFNEDYFFGVIGPRLNSDFRVPDPKIALSFAFEVKPQIMYEMNGNRLPFGCHAFERYDLDFWRLHLTNLTNNPTEILSAMVN